MKRNSTLPAALLAASVFGLSAALLTSCSKNKDDKNSGKVGNLRGNLGIRGSKLATPETPLELHVANFDGIPLAKVQVLIGDEANKPFANNVVETDANGIFHAPAGWTDKQAVTLITPGYLRATYLKQQPQGQVFFLRKAEGPRAIELKSSTTGFKIVDKDGLVDVGLVIPTLSKQELLNFDINMVLSTEIDQISVLGQSVDIPSNATLPKQRESYIFPITIEKAQSRLYFGSKGSKQLFIGRGQFPLKPVVDELFDGKSFYELTNYIKINGGALRDIEVTDKNPAKTFPVAELDFKDKRSFTTPAFEQEQMLMSVALSSYQGSYFPTDIKTVESRQKVTMVTAQGDVPVLLNVLKKKSEGDPGPGFDRTSASVQTFDEGAFPRLLPLMKNPQVLSLNHFRTEMIDATSGLTPAASYAVMSLVTEKTLGESTTQELQRLWEVYDPEWKKEYVLPNFQNDKFPKGLKKWEISRVAVIQSKLPEGKSLDLGPGMFDSVTHASHVSADFK